MHISTSILFSIYIYIYTTFSVNLESSYYGQSFGITELRKCCRRVSKSLHGMW